MYETEYYNRVAFSLSCLILFFIGANKNNFLSVAPAVYHLTCSMNYIAFLFGVLISTFPNAKERTRPIYQ